MFLFIPVISFITQISVVWEFCVESHTLFQAFFCTKPKNSVLVFQELRSQKSWKTQFLPENSVPKQGIYEYFHQKLLKKNDFWNFFAQKPQIFRKLSSKKAKTQFSRNPWNINSVKCVQKKSLSMGKHQSLDLRDISNTWHFTERRKMALKICTFKPRFFKLLDDLPFQPIAQNLHIHMHFNIFKGKYALLYWYWWENQRKCQTFDLSWKSIQFQLSQIWLFGHHFKPFIWGWCGGKIWEIMFKTTIVWFFNWDLD